MNPQIYRDREVLKIIDSAFEQFHITDYNEKLDISNAIKRQLDTSTTVSTYTEDPSASSATYRSNVRNALIDIIAHLLSAKDAKTELNQLEGISRDVMDQANHKLLILQKRLIGMNNKIKETFVEGLDVGSHSNTIVKEGHLRVNFLDKKIIPTTVETVIFPANSYYDGVTSTISKNENKLFKTGLGSDSFRATVTSRKKPGSYIMGNFLEGMTVQFTLETNPFVPKAISGKASTHFRIALWEGFDDSIQKWIVLGHDETLGQYSYIDTNLSNASGDHSQTFTKIRLSVYFPDYIKKDGKYFYEGILHNIKLFERQAFNRAEKGSFLSHKYTAPEGLFKIKFDATLQGWAICKIIYDGDLLNPYYVLPEASHLNFRKYYNIDLPDWNNEDFWNNNILDFKFIKHYDGQSGGIVLPLAPSLDNQDEIDVTTFKAFGENNQDINYTLSSSGPESNRIYSITPVGYTGYVFIIYALNSRRADFTLYAPLTSDMHEIVFSNLTLQKDLHNKLNNFIFPLSSFPFREDNGSLAEMGMADYYDDYPTFKFYIVGGPQDGVEIEAITEVFPVDGTIEFDDDAQEYYYFNKALYTNFNLYDFLNTNIRVEYNKTCDNIQVAIDLYDNATIDDYTLEMISLDKAAALNSFDVIIPEGDEDNQGSNNDGGGY